MLDRSGPPLMCESGHIWVPRKQRTEEVGHGDVGGLPGQKYSCSIVAVI